jgi:hypothetical protein
MKTLVILAAGALVAGSAIAQGGNFTAPVVRHNALPPANTAAQTEGGLQRAVRVGSPIQAFNPLAPKEYGEGREFIVRRDDGNSLPQQRTQDRARPVALRLFSFAF